MRRSYSVARVPICAPFLTPITAGAAGAAFSTGSTPPLGGKPGLVTPKGPGGTTPAPRIDPAPRPGIGFEPIDFSRTIAPPATGPRDVIVDRAAAAIRANADAARKTKKLAFDNPGIRDFKKSGHRALRKGFAQGVKPL